MPKQVAFKDMSLEQLRDTKAQVDSAIQALEEVERKKRKEAVEKRTEALRKGITKEMVDFLVPDHVQKCGGRGSNEIPPDSGIIPPASFCPRCFLLNVVEERVWVQFDIEVAAVLKEED